MTRIKKFKEFYKTNEVFGLFASKAGEVSGVVTQKFSNKPAAYNVKTTGTEDKDLGTAVLDKLRQMGKSHLTEWLNSKNKDFQFEWIMKYAKPLVDKKWDIVVKSRKKNLGGLSYTSPRDMFDKGHLTLQEAIDWIYDNGRDKNIDWNEVYLPNPSSETVKEKANSYYYFIDTFKLSKGGTTKSGTYRVEIIRHQDFKKLKSEEYTVTLTEPQSKQNRTYSKIKVRSRDVKKPKDYVPDTFADDYETRSELNLPPKIAQQIFIEAERIFKITNKTAKGNIRP